MAKLFEPLELRGVVLRNRIGVSPMCQYSAVDGLANDWHLVHLGSRAVGGAGLVIAEAAAVEARGRISPHDLGIYDDRHVGALARVAAFIDAHGAVPAIQIAHAGRKASTARPWDGGHPLSAAEGAWETIAPSPIAFSARHPTPREMSRDDLRTVLLAFQQSAERANRAGFRWLELHAAHGYLLHEFLSPLSNTRTDEYGGSLERRLRYPLEVAQAVRDVWPQNRVLAVRISATDWVDGGWSIDDSVAFAHALKEVGVDLIDCSSGGSVPTAQVPVGPGYQVGFAAQVRARAKIATAAVGLITEPRQAESIVADGSADLVLIARESLRDPYWPLHAALELGAAPSVPRAYERAFPKK